MPSVDSGCRSRGRAAGRPSGSVIMHRDATGATVRTTPDISFVARRAAVGDRRDSASTRSRTSSSSRPPSRSNSRRIVASGTRPSSCSDRSSSRGSSCGTSPTARSNSRTKTRNAASQSRSAASSRSSGLAATAAAASRCLLLEDGDDRVALADLALGDDPPEPLPVVADREIGHAGRPAPADAPRLRDALDDAPRLGLGEGQAGGPMAQAQRLADLAFGQRLLARHQVGLHAGDRRASRPRPRPSRPRPRRARGGWPRPS